jgi:hypothetical protein
MVKHNTWAQAISPCQGSNALRHIYPKNSSDAHDRTTHDAI